MLSLLPDRGGVPGAIRTVVSMPEKMQGADHYIGKMLASDLNSREWKAYREQAVMASLPMLVHMRKELPRLPSEDKNIDLYMVGIQEVVASLTPNEEGAIKFDPSRAGFYRYHKRMGAYICMRQEHVRLQMTATITDGDIGYVLAKTEKNKRRVTGVAKSLFNNRRTMSLSVYGDDDSDHNLVQALEGIISEPDLQLLSVTDVIDASNESVKWRIGIDQVIERLQGDRSFCVDLPVFRLATGYYPRVLPPRKVEDVAEQYGLAVFSTRRLIDRVFSRISVELQVDEYRLKRIVEALVDYELFHQGVDATDIARTKRYTLAKKGY